MFHVKHPPSFDKFENVVLIQFKCPKYIYPLL